MYKCDHTKLVLAFNEFHDVKKDDMPEYGDFCLLELRDGRHTAGQWYPNSGDSETLAGHFGRGTADSVDVSEVAKWHFLKRYDLTECLEDEKIRQINLGFEDEDKYSVKIGEFKSLKDGNLPESEQYCLLIMTDGSLAAGRWDQFPDGKEGLFIYASALASYSMDKVWAWTALSPDDVYEREAESLREKKREEELNRNPSADPDKFKYGTDISVYYEKALEKLRELYPWATVTQMKRKTPYVIVPRHGQYIFGMEMGTFRGEREVREWTDGSTADEFIDFLYDYTKETVKNYNPEEKFKFGTDIQVYLDKAYENVKKDYRWLEKEMLESFCQYSIKQVDGEWEYVKRYDENDDFSVYSVSSAEDFVKKLTKDYQDAALRNNPVVDTYSAPLKPVDLHGWGLEKYAFSKLQSGDYKVNVTAGDRTAGASREFFITPDCFEAKTYDEFLDRYLKIVPGGSFGLNKEDLIDDENLKAFLGYI
ncbi:MAG: hypothetical protein IKR23_11385 [Lachnospiraceae bacterium]|nr:hypothetical protein [Lachnospiraceae bacterium]